MPSAAMHAIHVSFILVFFQSNNNAMSPFLAGNDEILRMTAKSLCELHELTSISEHMRNFWIQ
jgi:hypothetical protein